MTPEALQAVREFLRSRGKGPNVAPEYVAKGLECTVEEAQAALLALRAEREPQPEPDKPAESREFDGKRLIVNLDGIPFNDPELLWDRLNLSRDKWELKRFKFKAYQGFAAQKAQSKVMKRPTRKGGGEYIAWERPEKTSIVKADLYSVEAVYEPKFAVIAAREEIEAMLAKLRDKAPKYAAIKPAAQPSGNLLELSLPDAHLGKLAWGNETGWEHYDLKIAERVFKEAFAALLQRTSGYKFDRVLLVPGNDFLNANGVANQTANGTPQSCDGRHWKTFRVARELTVWSIEQAMAIAPRVDVLPIPGNHDTEPVMYLSEVLSAWFRNTPQVHIDNAPRSRKLYRWGNVAIMFTHKGGKGAAAAHKNRMTMATEYRKAWGDAKFCEIHTGDLHQVRLEEEFGVRVRILPSLCPPDAWHAGEQYVGNIRCAEGYVWNEAEGLMNIAYYNVPGQGPRVEAA